MSNPFEISPAERQAQRKLIEDHIDAGTCYICGKPVEADQPVHGATGAHWDCAEKQAAEGDAAIAKLEALFKKRKAT